MTKKILIFSTAYYPFMAGAEIAVKEITDRIGEVEFDLITAKMDRKLPFRERVGNVTVYRLGIGVPLVDKLLLPFEGALFVRHLKKKSKYDFYWCVMASFASGAAYIANILNFKSHVPVILNLQEGDSEQYFRKKWFGLINFAWRLALNQTSLLTVISNYLGERARRFGFRGEMKLIPNGVDVKSFELRDFNLEERNKIRRGWGFGDRDTVLITSSRLNIKNGIGDVIEALVLLPENVKFVICGIGELRESLELRAKSLKVGDRVIFVGNISHDLLPKYLKSADIFIRPSLSEGFGLSFVEAMATRLPVIATRVGGIADFLVDPAKLEQSEMRSGMEVQTGYVCEPQNPESVAKTVQRVINDVGRNRIIENAYRMVKEKYDWDLIAGKMKEVFGSSI